MERSVEGGVVAYIHRLRQHHAPTFFTQRDGELGRGVCACDEPGCSVDALLVHIDDLLVAYQMKVDDLARETQRLERERICVGDSGAWSSMNESGSGESRGR